MESTGLAGLEHAQHNPTLSSSDMKNGLDVGLTCDAKIFQRDYILLNWVKAVGIFVILVAV